MRRKTYLSVVLTVIIATLFIIGFKYFSYKVTQPSFCASCHAVKSEYLVWAVSGHSQVNCLECHGEEGLKGLVIQNLKALTHGYLYLAQVKGKGTGFESKIPDARCQKCHTSKREVTPGGDLIIPHTEHINNPDVQCVDCHRDAVHGGDNGAQKVSELDDVVAPEEFKSQLKDNLQRKDFLPSMGLCLKCHDGKTAPSSCEACHKEITTPENHSKKEWNSGGHGIAARQDVAECIKCHALLTGSDQQPDVQNLSLYKVVDNNQFCRTCHVNRPPSHADDWEFLHRVTAEKDSDGCLACHMKENPEQLDEIAVSCNTCHENDHGNNWLRKHPSIVRENGTGDCYTCHGPNNCANCHTNRAMKLLQGLD